MRAIIAIGLADLRILARNKGAMFFTVFFPLLLALFFGAVFGGGGSGTLAVAVVDEAKTSAIAAFLEALAKESSLEVTSTRRAGEGRAPAPLTRDDGVALVRGGACRACVVIPKEYDSSLNALFSGGGMRLEVIAAPGASAESGLLTGKLAELSFRQLVKRFTSSGEILSSLDTARTRVAGSTSMEQEQRSKLLSMFDSIDSVTKSFRSQIDSAGVNEGAGAGISKPEGVESSGSSGASGAASTAGGEPTWSPISVAVTELKSGNDRPRSSWEISFPQGIVWALMGCVAAFATTLTADRARGTMVRLVTAPLTPGQILLGKALGCFVGCVTAQALLVALGAGVFGGIFHVFTVDNPLMLAAAVVAAALGFTGVMMLLAGFAQTEAAASGMGRGVIIILAMIGGGSVPMFFLPGWVQTLSNISPFKWATLAVEGALWRGFSWAQFALPAGVLLGFAILGFAAGTSALRRGGLAS